MNNLAPLQHVVELDAYNWLSQQAPYYIDAIEKCLRDGATPESIRRYISSQVGPDHQGIAIRAAQAAQYILREQHA
jgi:hypothetical protein